MRYNFLFGYAKSGKTTFLSTKEYSIDTSGFIYVMAERLNRTDILLSREIKDTSSDPAKRTIARNIIIDFVENYLIKRHFGTRRTFVRAAFNYYKDIIPMDYEGDVWVSTINMKEFEMLEDCLWLSDTYSTYNIRRDGELAGVDSRELHPNPDYTITARDGEFFYREGV
jgi:hypothetical protein